MKKLTLHFQSLGDIISFSKCLTGGYLLNTTNFTLTSDLSEPKVNLAIEKFNASVIETTDKVYSYSQID